MSVSELRQDPVTGRWVMVSTERPRADDFDRSPVVIRPTTRARSAAATST